MPAALTWVTLMDMQSLLDGLPTPSDRDMADRRQWARRYAIVFLREGPEPRDDEARNDRLQLEHLQHLTKLQVMGKLVLNGPTLIEHEILGVGIRAAGPEEAVAFAKADPKVKAGYWIAEALPWMAVPSEPRLDRAHRRVRQQCPPHMVLAGCARRPPTSGASCGGAPGALRGGSTTDQGRMAARQPSFDQP